MKKLYWILFICIILFSCQKKDTITLINKTSIDMVNSIISEVDSEVWEDINLLNKKVLLKNQSIEIDKKMFSALSGYDFGFYGEDGYVYFIWRVNVQNTDFMTIEPIY